MAAFIYSKIFKDAYCFQFKENENKFSKIIDYSLLEKTLKDFVLEIIGFRFDNNYNFSEIRLVFDNICRNIPRYSGVSLIEAINIYKSEYLAICASHPYVMKLIDVLKRLYSSNYDGKMLYENNRFYSDDSTMVVSHYNKTFLMCSAPRKAKPLPIVSMIDIDKLEEVLNTFIETIKKSDTIYNIFSNPWFESYNEWQKIEMIFEGTILNATAWDLVNVADFFQKYQSFVIDNSFTAYDKISFLGNAFDDNLFFAIRKSNIEYETPYYFSFMLQNSVFELPNIRLGIEDENDHKVAYIKATQSSQRTSNNERISAEAKRMIPNTSKYNFFNPNHFISLLLTFGILNGMGIKDIYFGEKMPLRYHKTIRDKNMSSEEAKQYLLRVIDKNKYTFLKLCLLCKGVTLLEKQENENKYTIHLEDEIICPNEELQHLYQIAYNLGKVYHPNEEIGRNQ